MKRIALTVPDFGQNYDELINKLAGAGYELVWIPNIAHTAEGVISAIRGFDAVIAGGEPWSAEALEGVRDTLKIIARHGVGVDKVDLEAASRAGVAVTNTPGRMSAAVAEQALAFMLCLSRRVALYDREMRAGEWRLTVTRETIGKTLGLVGFGAIGKCLAKLAAGFDYRLLAYDIAAASQPGVTMVGLDELLAESDFVSIHLPLTGGTRGIVNGEFLRKMKRTAFLINTSRGGLADEAALIAALQNGGIAGAALDVFETEPLPADSPLKSMPNVILSPHVGSATKESMDRMAACALENVTAYFDGQTPPDLLNPDYVKWVK